MTPEERLQVIDDQIDLEQMKGVHETYKGIVDKLDAIFSSDKQDREKKEDVFNVFVEAEIFSEDDLYIS